jgi:DNA modification methylase
MEGLSDSKSEARFFYSGKASKSDRNEGLPEGVRNNHQTVKPTSVMRWLCRLVTPPGGIILDPFCGSGSTGKAAMLEGFRFIGADIGEDNVKVSSLRVEAAERKSDQKEFLQEDLPNLISDNASSPSSNQEENDHSSH